MRIAVGFALILATGSFLLSGCHTAPSCKTDDVPVQRWFLEPSMGMQRYRTYGFLQVTAVRYQDPENDPTLQHNGFFGLGRYKHQDGTDHHDMPVTYTDELIWRVLQDEMNQKGYVQVEPQAADLWVIYYGGPRPLSTVKNLPVKGSPFNDYFCRNELREDTFFVDIIDAKTGNLLYRGWNQGFFKNRQLPESEGVVNMTREVVRFFPSPQ